jgi:hypothetical protein
VLDMDSTIKILKRPSGHRRGRLQSTQAWASLERLSHLHVVDHATGAAVDVLPGDEYNVAHATDGLRTLLAQLGPAGRRALLRSGKSWDIAGQGAADAGRNWQRYGDGAAIAGLEPASPRKRSGESLNVSGETSPSVDLRRSAQKSAGCGAAAALDVTPRTRVLRNDRGGFA